MSQALSCGEEETIQTKPIAEQITPLVQRQAEEEEPIQTKLLFAEHPIAPRQVEPEEEEEEEPIQTKLNSGEQPSIQRQEEPEEEEEIQGRFENNINLQRQEDIPEEKEEEEIQAKETSGQTPAVAPNLEFSIQSLKGSGQPLPKSVRHYFEPHFGHDFSQIREHSGTRAPETAQVLNTHTFSIGRDIAFDTGQYAAQTMSGKRRLAYELTPVVQQGCLRSPLQRERMHRSGNIDASPDVLRRSGGMTSTSLTIAHMLYMRRYEKYLKQAISLLEQAASRAKRSGRTFFGRTVQGICRKLSGGRWLKIPTYIGYDTRYWRHVVDCGKGESKLVHSRGSPALAIDEMFKNLHRLWTFDCAEYLQVARWYALRWAAGKKRFNAKIRSLGTLELKPHGSTGLSRSALYVRSATQRDFVKQYPRTRSARRYSERTLLKAAPFGSRIMWTNRSLLNKPWVSHRHFNTLKLGPDRFAFHPYGTGSRAYVECTMALRGRGYSSNQARTKCRASLSGFEKLLTHYYIIKNIFIEKIEYTSPYL